MICFKNVVGVALFIFKYFYQIGFIELKPKHVALAKKVTTVT